VGTGTVLADDPQLTVREADGGLAAGPQPLRVVVGSREVPAGRRVRDDAAPTLLLATHRPTEVVAQLHARGCHHVLLEGGPTLAAAFCRAGLVDQVVAYVAPVLLGAGPSAVGDLGVGSIDEALRLDVDDVTVLGPDVRITARIGSPDSGRSAHHSGNPLAEPTAPAEPVDLAEPPSPDTRGR
jgi:diaminohydroxyphosphoribosylaminopyrimidine deaminase / 5-amino-6-(5-phosphoribosylamino)uracil reductase